MDARRIIGKLRQKQSPTREELTWFAQGLADQSVSDAQAGAFAMGVCVTRLTDVARVGLTMAMRDSGTILDWKGIDKPVLDKHSTGGVGDSASLVLAPALAACGAAVPMISGRGLGHTGGTLDKLESIPGVSTSLAGDRLREAVKSAGAAIVGASSDIAPADKRLYAVRDMTGTVESLDLITASILSKKLAAGLDGLVLDVKVGSGAFMKTMDQATALAEALVRTANAAGCKTTALISDMGQPLVPAVGNALEVAEVARTLTGRSKGPVLDLVAALGGVLLAGSGLAKDVQEGSDKIAGAIRSGQAAENFGRMIAAQGGPLGFMDNWARFLPEATVIREVTTRSTGFVTAIDGEGLGHAAVALGAGRRREGEAIDPAVGFSELVRYGAKVGRGTVLGVVHAVRQDQADAAEQALRAAISIGPASPARVELIHAAIN